MSFINCKFQGNGGEFEVKNIMSYSFSAFRSPGANGHVGQKGHEIGLIHITRRKSLQDDGVAKLEEETIKLAAATEKKAYFKGTITLARPDDAADIIQTLRWDSGHICNLSCQVSEFEVTETIDVCVTELNVDNSTFKRGTTS